MKRTATGNGVYKDEQGGLWARPWINKRRTWRRLYSTNQKKAQEESENLTDKAAGSFTQAADEYLSNQCPDRRLEERGEAFCVGERTRIGWLKQFFGKFKCEQIKIALLPAFKQWRVSKVGKGTGERTVDLEMATLSNVLNYQVALGRLDVNFIRSGRPRFRKDSDVRKSRDVAPKDAEAIHRAVKEFFSNPKSESLGWLALLHEFTGCRTSELLRLRMDAKDETQAGFISGNHLFLGRRSKGGLNPWAMIGPEFADMLEAFKAWHKERTRGKENPWFFIGRGGHGLLDKNALAHGLKRIAKSKGWPHFTPHGLRSFYVTKRRSDGATDSQIAAEIGDKTVSLISQTYGDAPKSWTGGLKLEWTPKGEKPAWKGILVQQKWTKAVSAKSRKTHRRPVKSGAPTRS